MYSGVYEWEFMTILLEVAKIICLKKWVEKIDRRLSFKKLLKKCLGKDEIKKEKEEREASCGRRELLGQLRERERQEKCGI